MEMWCWSPTQCVCVLSVVVCGKHLVVLLGKPPRKRSNDKNENAQRFEAMVEEVRPELLH